MINPISNINSISQTGVETVTTNQTPSASTLAASSTSDHFAQFYEKDAFLLTSLRSYVSAGLSSDEAVIVVATKNHRDRLQELLEAEGVDVVLEAASGKYLALDAADTLEQFIVEGWPDGNRFTQVIGAIIERAAQGGRRVRVFGEMVALLWADGKQQAAIELEEEWNKLQKTTPFALFCGYPIYGFKEKDLFEPLASVCAKHSHVLPAESYVSLATPSDRLEAIIRLQQKANLLQAEVAERKRAEEAMRVLKDELEVQISDLSRLHEMSARLTLTLDVGPVLREVLRGAMAVQGTEMGVLLLCDDSEKGVLEIGAHSGLAEDFLNKIKSIPKGEGACGLAYQQRRQVILEDMKKDQIFPEYREAAEKAGIQACHSTPLITRRGNIVGVLSVHFGEQHRPSEREIKLMDLYARMAADMIENAQLHHRVQQELNEREELLGREQDARAQAEKANRMKDEFLATVSHELRTPLNAIIGWSHMLRNGQLDQPTVVHALETIERNAKSQAQLVEDILDVSRVITGQLRLNTGPVDLAAVINSSIDSVQLAAESKGIQLNMTLEPMARHTMGDAGRLQQVVWNLLSNAIKFTPSGGHVEIKLDRLGSKVRIRVSDSGQGISNDFLPFIFDRFRQADGTSTRRHGGLGLGLAIVRHLVELHGGTVDAQSEEGLGSTFTVTLPLLITEQPEHKPRTGRLLPVAISNEVSSLPSLDSVKVLLVDDDPDTLQVLSVMLSGCRANVHAVKSAKEALEVATWFQPSVIVSDLAMPDEDGYSLIARIRSSAEQFDGTVPAVALTSYVRVEDRARALAAGFNMFVPKPVQPDELVTAISNLMETQQTN